MKSPTPRYRKGWTKTNGETVSGFWYWWNGKSKISLGISEEKKSRKGQRLAEQALADSLVEHALAQKRAKDPTLAMLIDAYLADFAEKVEARSDPKRKTEWRSPESLRAAMGYLFDFVSGYSCKWVDGKPTKGKRLHEGFGSLTAGELERAHIARWLACHKGWGAKTQGHAISYLKAACSLALHLGTIKVNPMAGYRVAGSEPRRMAWEQWEIDLALSLASPALARLMRAIATTGARPGELCQCTAEHFVEIEGQPFLVLGERQWKNGRKRRKPRYIPLVHGGELYQLALEAKMAGDNRALLRGAFDGRWTLTRVGSAFRYCKQKCVAVNPKFRVGLHIYDLRGTAITRLVGAGVSKSTVATMTGTSESMIDRTYLTDTPASLAAMGRAMVGG